MAAPGPRHTLRPAARCRPPRLPLPSWRARARPEVHGPGTEVGGGGAGTAGAGGVGLGGAEAWGLQGGADQLGPGGGA